jgi:hypothetical protein
MLLRAKIFYLAAYMTFQCAVPLHLLFIDVARKNILFSRIYDFSVCGSTSSPFCNIKIFQKLFLRFDIFNCITFLDK